MLSWVTSASASVAQPLKQKKYTKRPERTMYSNVKRLMPNPLQPYRSYLLLIFLDLFQILFNLSRSFSKHSCSSVLCCGYWDRSQVSTKYRWMEYLPLASSSQQPDSASHNKICFSASPSYCWLNPHDTRFPFLLYCCPTAFYISHSEQQLQHSGLNCIDHLINFVSPI